MKRSEINAVIRRFEALLAEHCFELPPFCKWTPEEWQNKGHEYDEIRDNMLGWDVTDYGMGDYFDVVYSGKWTFDFIYDAAKDAYSDLNGDTMMDENAINKILKIANLFSDRQVYYNTGTVMDAVTGDGLTEEDFSNGKTLFFKANMFDLEQMRSYDIDIGFLPCPKYDEDQENYYTLARNVYSSMVIPKTCDKLDAVGAAMEAMAAQNYKNVSPVYFETALKVKYSRDDATSQMYDLIKQGLRFNFAFTFSAVSGGFANIFADMVGNNDENYMSKYESIRESKETGLQKFYDDVESFE